MCSTQFWKLTDNLPTGKPAKDGWPRRSPPATPIHQSLNLDDIFTDLVHGTKMDERYWTISTASVFPHQADAVYRDVVAFTPANREAVCTQPVTFPTDAINLQATTPDMSWQILTPRRMADDSSK